MKGRKLQFSIIFLFLILISCQNEPDYDEDLLVGTVRVMDWNIPYPYLIEKSKNKFFLIDYRNKIIDSSGTGAPDLLLGSNIEMNDHNFLVVRSKNGHWLLDKQDSLNFYFEHPIYAAQFVNAETSSEIDFQSLKEELQKNSYQTTVPSVHFATPNRDLRVVKTLNFSSDQLETLYTYFYRDEPVFAEKKVSQYNLFERKGKIFFSEGQDLVNTVNLYQVSFANAKTLSLRSFRNGEEINESFKISEAPEEAPGIRTFKRCMEGQPGEYYHNNLTFSKGNEFLIRKIGKNAPPATGDGYITVHFTINCEGIMGHLGLEQMDRDFQSTSFEPELIQHIIKEVMDLKDWPEVPAGRFYKDIHSFLMFRIKNGKITDLCP